MRKSRNRYPFFETGSWAPHMQTHALSRAMRLYVSRCPLFTYACFYLIWHLFIHLVLQSISDCKRFKVFLIAAAVHFVTRWVGVSRLGWLSLAALSLCTNGRSKRPKVFEKNKYKGERNWPLKGPDVCRKRKDPNFTLCLSPWTRKLPRRSSTFRTRFWE